MRQLQSLKPQVVRQCHGTDQASQVPVRMKRLSVECRCITYRMHAPGREPRPAFRPELSVHPTQTNLSLQHAQQDILRDDTFVFEGVVPHKPQGAYASDLFLPFMRSEL